MKTTFKILALLVAMVGFSAASYSQTVTASATIVTPVSVTGVDNLQFGNINASGSGTVILSTTGSRTPSSGITLPSILGDPKAAKFTVAGQANFTFSIQLPSSVTLNHSSGAGTGTMTVGTFTSDPATTGTLDGSGTKDVLVGATLTIGAAQAPGTYTSATPFTITVAYN
jgi:hypothetical protein